MNFDVNPAIEMGMRIRRDVVSILRASASFFFYYRRIEIRDFSRHFSFLVGFSWVEKQKFGSLCVLNMFSLALYFFNA